jgi:biopolymer transport protein ExbB/TolQ
MLYPYMQAGGWLMWPLAACSVVLIGLLVERVYTVVLVHRLLGRPVDPAELRRHRAWVPFFLDVPPAIGLLGTVVGLIQSFALLEDRMSDGSVGAGLATACLTTLVGLTIAIVASVARYFLDWLTAEAPAPAPADAPNHAPATATSGEVAGD